MPLPTIITCAGSWPDPEPWITETLSSRGASVRMIRLYSGTYFRVPGWASAIPLSISGTNCCGSLTNFFMAILHQGGSGPGREVRPLVGKCLEDHGDGDGSGVERADAALARVAGPPAHGLHGARRLGMLPGGDSSRAQRGGRIGAGGDLLLDGVDGRDERIEQRLVADIGPAAGPDPLDGGAQHRPHPR